MISLLDYFAPTTVNTIRCRGCGTTLEGALPKSAVDEGFKPYCGVQCMPVPPPAPKPKR